MTDPNSPSPHPLSDEMIDRYWPGASREDVRRQYDSLMLATQVAALAAPLPPAVPPTLRERLLHTDPLVCDPVSLRPRRRNPDGPDAVARMDRMAATLAAVADALRLLRAHPCPVCSGDCSAANPPVLSCPVAAIDSALAAIGALPGDGPGGLT